MKFFNQTKRGEQSYDTFLVILFSLHISEGCLSSEKDVLCCLRTSAFTSAFTNVHAVVLNSLYTVHGETKGKWGYL